MAVDFKELKREDCRTVARRLGLELNRQDKARCFLHAGDKNPSLQVYADGWKCFGCGEHGDAVDLISKYLMAYKRLRATNGAGGVTLDDLMQAGFLGFPEAVRAYDPSAGFRFSSYLTYPVKSAFSEAEGRRSEKQKRDPIFSAVSIDAPLDKGEGEPLTLADVIPDPHAAEALEGVGVWDTLHRAVNGLPEGQREEIRRRYWLNQTTAEISTATGTPEKEVRKLEAAALRALRHPSVSRMLREYR